MTLPALDEFFREKNTGRLKMEWTFVVDNGPSEQPSCPLVQMCLVRLVNLPKLYTKSYRSHLLNITASITM